MDVSTVGLFTLLFMFILMMAGVPIAFALGFSALCAGLFAYGGTVLPKLGMGSFRFMYNVSWTPLPLFVLLGTLMAETRIGDDLFSAASKWLSRVPGGLVAGGVIGEGIMAAVIGTSAATIVVVGKTAVPAFEKYGYNRKMGLGALLAGGVLGPLIPPSATMIIYGVLAEMSIGQLFIAGIIPGIILIFMLAVPTILWCWWKPNWGPPGRSYSWGERVGSLKNIWPVVIVMLAILGSIYFGVATPTESAGVGVVVILIIAAIFYGLKWKGLRDCLVEATLVNAMIMFICLGAYFFTYMIGSANIATKLSDVINTVGLSPIFVIISINVILIILGCLIDPITITLLTVPIFVPLIIEVGYDPLWFGVMFVINTEIGLITPPMGINLFAIKTIFNISTKDLLQGVIPFLLIEIAFLAVIIAFPQLSLWLPGTMMGG
jgi:tripartite ATP-independent transporter DctM subunit